MRWTRDHAAPHDTPVDLDRRLGHPQPMPHAAVRSARPGPSDLRSRLTGRSTVSLRDRLARPSMPAAAR